MVDAPGATVDENGLHGLYTPLAQNPDELHAAHGSPFAPSYPKSHTQAVTSDIPAPQCEFDGQATQSSTAAFPVDPWYVLTGQLTQVSGLVAPTVGEYRPTPHCVHADFPPSGWYDPAGHASHTDAAADAVYDPAAQSMHSVELGAGAYCGAAQLRHAWLAPIRFE